MKDDCLHVCSRNERLFVHVTVSHRNSVTFNQNQSHSATEVQSRAITLSHMFSFRFCKQLTPQPATVSHLLMLVDFSKEILVTIDQQNESDRKHRLKTDGLGNQDEEVFAIHTSLGGGFIDDKKVETTARALAYGQMRCWSRDHGCSNLHSRF